MTAGIMLGEKSMVLNNPPLFFPTKSSNHASKTPITTLIIEESTPR